MLKPEDINRLIGVAEAYQMPDKLMATMMDPDLRERLFESFLQLESDLSFDWFTDYFQTEHGDRAKLKQDYTPDCVTTIMAEMAGHAESYCDLCAGCGGLTIKVWKNNPDAFFLCEEISSRVLPVLLFNLAIRNIRSLVLHGDSLTQEYQAYQLEPGERFSTCSKMEQVEIPQVDRVISNPPYSLPWTPKPDARFDDYGLAPKSKADFAFVLHGLSRLKDDGKAFFILPHGVLFRGQAEGKIRQKLLERRQIRSIVGLPSNLFLYTQIPVCVLELTKSDNNELFVVDAQRLYTKQGKQNVMEKEHLESLFEALKGRSDVERLASIVSWEQVKENDYNLNIPRYVDTSDPPEEIDLAEVFRDLAETERQIQTAEMQIFEELKSLTGFDYDQMEAMKEWAEICGLTKPRSKRSPRSKGRKTVNSIQPALF